MLKQGIGRYHSNMERFPIITELIETAQPWIYRASIYLSNVFVDDPAILAFAFC